MVTCQYFQSDIMEGLYYSTEKAQKLGNLGRDPCEFPKSRFSQRSYSTLKLPLFNLKDAKINHHYSTLNIKRDNYNTDKYKTKCV